MERVIEKKDITQIDKNMAASVFNQEGNTYVYFNHLDSRLDLSGFAFLKENDNELIRLPKNILNSVRENVKLLSYHNSGGMIRFMTTSSKIAIKAELLDSSDMNHFARSAMSGIDVYFGSGANKKFYKNIAPAYNEAYMEGIAELPGQNGYMIEVTLCLPLYNHIKDIKIGVLEGSQVCKPIPMTYEKPIAFYGSSIVQGGCSSRVGTCYTNMLGRWLDSKILNFGFSGNAMGEEIIAEIIAKVDMSIFIYDYDFNAPDPAHLNLTHHNFYKIIRKAKPNIPIIMISKCEWQNAQDEIRRDIIYKSYKKAVSEGDSNVYFVDGSKFFGDFGRELCTVDTVHPNDYGFYRMAKYLYPMLRELLEK